MTLGPNQLDLGMSVASPFLQKQKAKGATPAVSWSHHCNLNHLAYETSPLLIFNDKRLHPTRNLASSAYLPPPNRWRCVWPPVSCFRQSLRHNCPRAPRTRVTVHGRRNQSISAWLTDQGNRYGVTWDWVWMPSVNFLETHRRHSIPI